MPSLTRTATLAAVAVAAAAAGAAQGAQIRGPTAPPPPRERFQCAALLTATPAWDVAGSTPPTTAVALELTLTNVGGAGQAVPWTRGLGEGAAAFKEREGELRGEVTLVVERPPAAATRPAEGEGEGEGEEPSPSVDAAAALASLLADGVPPTAAAKALAKALGVSRAGLYAAAVAWKEERGGGGGGGEGGGG